MNSTLTVTAPAEVLGALQGQITVQRTLAALGAQSPV